MTKYQQKKPEPQDMILAFYRIDKEALKEAK